MIGLFKTELIRRHSPWRTIDEVELATLDWVDWYNTRRPHGELRHIPPAEHEAAYYAQQEATPRPETNRPSLYQIQDGSVRWAGAVAR